MPSIPNSLGLKVLGFRVLGFRVLLRAKPEHANSKMSILRGAYMKARASGLDDKVID